MTASPASPALLILLALSAAPAAAGGAGGAEAAPPHRDALGADDVCGAQAGGACAVHTLQFSSSAARTSSATAAQEMLPPERHPEDDPNWVWPRSVADMQQRTDRIRGNPFQEDLFRTFAPRMVEHCLSWSAYFWPMMSFWSQEVLRRVEAMPADADAAHKEKLQKFAMNASYLMCDFWFDPRKGTEWSQPVTEYMQGIYSAPSTDLDMPKLDGYFRRSENIKHMWSADACMFWSSSLMCDLGVWSRERQGNKGRDGICWDRVQIPEYGFTVFGASLQPDRQAAPDSFEFFAHEEYGECMEQPPSKEDLEVHCPMFGHYHKGFLNVTNWGSGYAAGSNQYHEVLQCQDKLDIPLAAATTSALVRRPWQDNITLMDAPEDPKDAAFELDPQAGMKMMEHVFAILRERDDWRASRGYKNMRKFFNSSKQYKEVQ